MAEVTTPTGGGSVDDKTILLLFGGLALLLVAGVWAARKAAEDIIGGVKDIPGDVWDYGADAARGLGGTAYDRIKGSGEYYGKKAAAAKLATYQGEKIIAATQIEAKRAAHGSSNYGTVGGSIGEHTGEWFPLEPTPSGSARCYVLSANQFSSNSTRFFTGGYCRRAKEQGLL
jgi:hypothetical protein